MAFSPLSWSVLAATVGLVVYHFTSSSKRRRNLPPGPKPFPILGNVFDMPPPGELEFMHWLKHKDLYGGISSVSALGMTLVFVHDRKAAHDLLEHNSLKTSGRPGMTFANKMCGYESILICQNYDSRFRHYRKLLHQEIGTKASAAQFRDVQEVEVNRQLLRALNEPKSWLKHFRTTIGAAVLKIAYGYTIEPHKPDILVDLVDKVMTEFSEAAVPMAWPVDLIPALQYLPEGFPGITFQKTARKFRATVTAATYIPYRFAKQQIAGHNYRQSLVSRLLHQYEDKRDEKGNLSREDEEAIVWPAASLYGAAADTLAITLTAFTLAMVIFPQVQRKAQEEIDRVVGTDRLPTFEDREKLPYVNALIKEALRWWPIAPQSFPHLADEDIEYNGMLIPKGAYILPSVWWFLHDPEVYPDPLSFDPERFLSPRNEPDPDTEAFGYGRRRCPGAFFADSSLYINMVQCLATFKIHKALDKNGKEIDVEAKIKPGVLSYPEEFQFEVEPRSEKHADLIKAVEKKQPWEAGDGELLEDTKVWGVQW